MNVVRVKPSLEELRQLIGQTQRLEREKRSFSLFPEGFPKAALIEVSGYGKTECVALYLKEHPELKVVWIETEITVNPYALFQKGLRTENILFIEAGDQFSWCLTQALSSGCFQVLVTALDRDSSADGEKNLRRYQLLAEKNHTQVFIFSEELHTSWVPNLQLRVLRDKSGFKIETAKRRMG